MNLIICLFISLNCPILPTHTKQLFLSFFQCFFPFLNRWLIDFACQVFSGPQRKCDRRTNTRTIHTNGLGTSLERSIPRTWQLILSPIVVKQYPTCLTPALPWCHLKTTMKLLNLNPLTVSVLYFALSRERIFIETHSICLNKIVFIHRNHKFNK